MYYLFGYFLILCYNDEILIKYKVNLKEFLLLVSILFHDVLNIINNTQTN